MKKIILQKDGKNLRLRVATLDDLDFIMQTERDPENSKFVMALSREGHQAQLNTPSRLHFIVEEKATNERIGFLMVNEIDNPHNEVEWHKIIINKKGHGYGKEALKLLMAWSFEDMKFHRGWLDCKDYNTRALHVYESVGLKREALLRETILVNGVYENLVILAILENEYFSEVKKSL